MLTIAELAAQLPTAPAHSLGIAARISNRSQHQLVTLPGFLEIAPPPPAAALPDSPQETK